MPPKAKDAKKGLYKQGTPLKDIIPATVKQPPLEGRPIRIPEYVPSQTVINPYEPQPEFEEWPGDEAALNFDFGLESQAGKAYVDPVKFSVPPSFKSNENQIIFWRRPRELVRSELSEAPMSVTNLRASDAHFKRAGTMVEGELNEGRRSIFHDDVGPFEKEDMDITLFDVYDREETPEEVAQRLKEIAEKQQQVKKKPAGKKEEPVDTNPLKIKDVRLSNVSMKEEIPAYAKWIASQLQVIKDRNIRDINTKKPIWTKIYPQKDGVPVYNPSGRYWVKLYYMGKEKKIDIDDKIPVIYGKSLFAKSVKETEIWPIILTKALIKLNSTRWNDEKAKEIEVGDGSIIYALTGYVPETINLSSNYHDKWRTIVSALSDKNYNTGDKYITCFCLPNFKPAPAVKGPTTTQQQTKTTAAAKRESPSPRNLALNDSRGNSVDSDAKSPGLGAPKRKEQHSQTQVVKSPRPEPLQTAKKDEPTREKASSNIIPGFAYSVVDLFENEGFNMVYVLKRTENDVKLRTEYMNLQKVNMNKMTKEEKVEHRRMKKDLSNKITAEDNKRMELIKTPAKRYKLFKVRSGAKAPALNFECPFDDEDITLAKRCILNRLSKPPNYDLYDLKMDDKSVTSSQQVTIESHKILPLDDFSKIENVKEPLKRGTIGSWIQNEDLDRQFQYIQIFHDPTKFKYKETFPLPVRADEELINYEDKEVIVLEGEDEEEKDEDRDRERDKDGSLLHPFLYSFASSRPANSTIEPKPALCLQKYDFQNFEVAFSYKTLNQPHDSDCLILNNKNQVFRIQLVSPLTSFMWISSNLHFKLMSITEFLCAYEGYQAKSQPIDYPIIEKNRYHLFYKGIVNPLSQSETVICKLKNSADLAMLRSVRIRLVELTSKTYSSDEDFSTGVVTFPLEQTFYTLKAVPITLEAQKRYMIVVEGRMTDTVNEGALEMEILFRGSDFTLETVEQVEPLEYMDKYIPTKYGVLFRERLFLNTEAQASFFVRISDVLGASTQQQTAQKGAKKGEVPQFEEKDLTEMRTVKLELFRDNDLVSFSTGQNKAILSNVSLFPTNNKDEPRNYFLQASLDLREWPEGKDESEQTSNLHWIMKVHSSDTLAIFKDTFKEDNIKAIKKSWEDKEPGRAEKAKTARKKFMIQEKIRRGEDVTRK